MLNNLFGLTALIGSGDAKTLVQALMPGCKCSWLHPPLAKSKYFFIKKVYPFSWGHWYPFLNFWWHILWVSKPLWTALFALGGDIQVTHSIRFNSGATPADILVARMAAKPFSLTYLWASIVGAWNWDLSCCHYLTVRDQPDVLPTDLCRLGSEEYKLHCSSSKKSTKRY